MSCVVVGPMVRGGVAMTKQCQTASFALATSLHANQLLPKSMFYLVHFDFSTNYLHANDLLVKIIYCCMLFC